MMIIIKAEIIICEQNNKSKMYPINVVQKFSRESRKRNDDFVKHFEEFMSKEIDILLKFETHE